VIFLSQNLIALHFTMAAGADMWTTRPQMLFKFTTMSRVNIPKRTVVTHIGERLADSRLNLGHLYPVYSRCMRLLENQLL
jgi:hypothetical protein